MSSASATILCTFFQKGKCTKGTSCRFSHEAIAPAPPVLIQCTFFLAGKCTKGSSCRFAHEPIASVTASAPSAETVIDSVADSVIDPVTETDELTDEDFLNIAMYEYNEEENQDDENLEELDEMLFKLDQEWLIEAR